MEPCGKEVASYLFRCGTDGSSGNIRRGATKHLESRCRRAYLNDRFFDLGLTSSGADGKIQSVDYEKLNVAFIDSDVRPLL